MIIVCHKLSNEIYQTTQCKSPRLVTLVRTCVISNVMIHVHYRFEDNAFKRCKVIEMFENEEIYSLDVCLRGSSLSSKCELVTLIFFFSMCEVVLLRNSNST